MFLQIRQVGFRERTNQPLRERIALRGDNQLMDCMAFRCGDKNRHAYLLGVVYKKMVKPTFGIGKMREIYWLEIYATEEQQVVEDTFALFFTGESEKLMARLRTRRSVN